MSLLPLALSMTRRTFKLGSPLILQGDVTQEAMIIIQGECQVVRLRTPRVFTQRKEWSATTEKDFFAPPVKLSELAYTPWTVKKTNGNLPVMKRNNKSGQNTQQELEKPLQQGDWIKDNHKDIIYKSQYDVICNIGVGEPLALRSLLTKSYKFADETVTFELICRYLQLCSL